METISKTFSLISYQGKKFAKLELKSCIEEFEQKLNQIHVDRKEQEKTTRNAQVYQQQIGNIKGFVLSKEGTDEESNDADGRGFAQFLCWQVYDALIIMLLFKIELCF